MLSKELRTAILALAGRGSGIRQIAKAVGVSRHTVKAVLRSGAAAPPGIERAALLDPYLDDIRAFHETCRTESTKRIDGSMQRVWEMLGDKLKRDGCELEVPYSTLTRFCREHGIGVREKKPSGRIVTEPGEEAQHDTSPYTIKVGGKMVKRHCASLVLGYSRMVFILFFERFQRFHVKVFLTEAFKYFGGSCRRIVIDNSSVVIACGAGRFAQVSPEIEAFEKRFGFGFLAHEVGHADRSGKVERVFDYIEKNFLVGRVFKDDDDLNGQAFEWADQKANRRRLRELKASPVELFAVEKPSLMPIPLFVPEVYRLCSRGVDAYGCVSLHGMKYPVPAAYIGKTVLVRETKDRVIALDGRDEIAVHKKKIEGSPSSAPPPLRTPRRQKSIQLAEESKLKGLGVTMQAYLAELKAERGPRYIWSVKKLYELLCEYRSEDLVAAVARAGEHRLFDVGRIETILLQSIAQKDYALPLDFEAQDYEKLPEYQEGAVTPEPDLSDYAPEEEEDDRPTA